MVLEKTLESPLDCKEIQPIHSEGDQPWDFFGRLDQRLLLWMEVSFCSQLHSRVQPSFLLPSVFPSIRVFSKKSVLHIRWAKVLDPDGFWGTILLPWWALGYPHQLSLQNSTLHPIFDSVSHTQRSQPRDGVQGPCKSLIPNLH